MPITLLYHAWLIPPTLRYLDHSRLRRRRKRQLGRGLRSRLIAMLLRPTQTLWSGLQGNQRFSQCNTFNWLWRVIQQMPDPISRICRAVCGCRGKSSVDEQFVSVSAGDRFAEHWFLSVVNRDPQFYHVDVQDWLCVFFVISYNEYTHLKCTRLWMFFSSGHQSLA